MLTLAFLNLGPTEILLVLVLLLLFFGAEQLPAMARRVGRWKGQFDRAQDQIRDSVMLPEEKSLIEQMAFERARDLHMQKQNEERAALEQTAASAGVLTDGLTEEEIRNALAARATAAPALEENETKTAAGAAKP